MGFAKLTLQGINDCYEMIHGKDIFDDISLPDGINHDDLVNRIYIRAGEFSVMHTDIEYFHNEILNFFTIHYETFNRWMEVLSIDYDPIENYNRYEDYAGNGSSSGTDIGSSSESGTNTLNKSAFNSSGYEPYERNTISNSTNSSDSTTGRFNDEHNSHIHGNIGVTTSQQMIESELELRKFNIYLRIADLFVNEFCLMVY